MAKNDALYFGVEVLRNLQNASFTLIYKFVCPVHNKLIFFGAYAAEMFREKLHLQRQRAFGGTRYLPQSLTRAFV